MNLKELEATFIQRTDTGFRRIADKVVADGVLFLCPKCFEKNGGPKGTHQVICWTPSVPLSVRPGPGRWDMVGDSVGNLTLVAGSSSVRLTGSCGAHFVIRSGEIINC